MLAVSDESAKSVTDHQSQRSTEAPALEAIRISKRYGEVRALDDVSLQIRAGEFLTLLGPSGSGKTTLLNAIAGFEGVDEGDLLFRNESLLRTRPEKRDFGFVFQSYALFPHMTVADNVGYPLRLRGMRKAERERRVRETLELVELEHLAERFPAQLSGGQQQRVAVARALVFSPKVLLMDEPLSALDRKLRTSLQFELKKLHDRLGLTVVFVTHDQEEALTMSDRIAVMRSGRIVQVGSPMDLYEHPASRFVADFLGENNFLPATLLDRSGTEPEARIEGTDTVVRVQRARAHVDPDAEADVLSVRPEDIVVVDPASGDAGTLPARVISAAFLGDSWRYECRLPTGQAVLVKQHKTEQVLAEQSEILLRFVAAKTSLFTVPTSEPATPSDNTH